MADLYGSMYVINGRVVTSPDEEVWADIVLGENLEGLERRSPYKQLKWRKVVAAGCQLEWFDYDGLALSSLTCTPPGEVGIHRTFTNSQICVSVAMRAGHGTAREVTATFLVDTREVVSS